MKKLLCILPLLLVFTILLSSCVQNEIVDIYVFSSRFNRYSDNFRIDKKEFCAEEDKGELIFPICFENKFLICVRTDEKTSQIKSCSVTYGFMSGKREIGQNDYEKLLEIVSCAVKACGKYDNDFADSIVSKSGLKSKKSLVTDTDVSFTKDFYEYDLICDKAGVYFSMKSKRI